MDIWKYYDVTHRKHLFCNPMSGEKLERLIELLRLRPGARALDVACGKGEFLVRLATRYHVSGVGIDISPYYVRDAKRKLTERSPGGTCEFINMDGADYEPEARESFDCASCIGASWIYKGHEGTVRALIGMVKPGGLVIVGEPFWLKEPDEEYLKADNCERDTFGTHQSNIETGESLGLTLLYTLVSDQEDWDHYEGLQWHTVDRYALEYPDDPDLPEIRDKNDKAKEIYLKWGRYTLGWAIYLFRKSG
jgi:SAM-dependent methyltransferase